MEKAIERIIDRRLASSQEFEFLVQYKDHLITEEDQESNTHDGCPLGEWVPHEVQTITG